MVKVNLLNSHVYVFILSVLLGIVIISVYSIFKPEETVPYNFDPYPNVAPTDLPDPNRPTDTCWNKLTPCDNFGNCSACSNDEYKCTEVSQEQADNKYYTFNGINVPKGNWCLPADKNPDPQCNLYTGRWIWSYDPAYCNSITPGSTQCWKCECLYPSLFNGPGCNTQIGCQNTSLRSNSLSQPNNKLFSNNSFFKEGCAWDPSGSPSGNCEGVFNYTPYDKDKDGNPWFVCDCADVSTGQYFNRLPGDPHSCHLNPCSSSMGSTLSSDINITNDSVSCECESTNLAKAPLGDYKNTCVLIENSCYNGGWDSGAQKCTCGSGPYWERSCKNTLFNINNDTDLPDCEMPSNMLGSECVNLCERQQCNNGSDCISCGPGSSTGIGLCLFDSEWNVLKDPDQVHAICDCSSTQPPSGTTYIGGFFGPTCSNQCLKDGTKIYWKDQWGHVHPNSQGCNCCCSLSIETHSDYYGLDEYETCGSYGWPSGSRPPDPRCLPASTTCEDKAVE